MNQIFVERRYWMGLVFMCLMGTLSCGRKQVQDHREGSEFSSALESVLDSVGSADVEIYSKGTSREGPVVTSYKGEGDIYSVGVAREDVTGSASDVMMMGYVDTKQKSAGFATRQYARALVMSEPSSNQSVAMAVVDSCQVTSAVREEVVKIISKKTNGVLNSQNILLTATHSHNVPGGISHYKLYRLSSLGFSDFSFRAMVDGTVKAIEAAYQARVPGRAYVSNGDVQKLNRNRSPMSYELNPASERAQYTSDVNKMMTVLRLDDLNGKSLGLFSWFAVHATSIESDNKLIDGDNKGYAALAFEKALSRSISRTGAKGFVAAFATLEGGDSTPNIEGDLDGDGDWDCAANTNDGCVKYSGGLHAAAAMRLFESQGAAVSGPLDSVLHFVDMSQIEVESEFSKSKDKVKTCEAALGVSMFAGIATDHAGIGKEGVRCEDMKGLLGEIMCKGVQDECQAPKPVALNLGGKKPSPWGPDRLPLQVMRLGQLAFVGVPGEFTTMSGRRTRSAVQSILSAQGIEQVLLAGYANAYSGYVTTHEEYQLQRYEGASTHFGPWTQAAYAQELSKLAHLLADPSPSRTAKLNTLQPRDLSQESRLEAKRYGIDRPWAFGRDFGFCLTDVQSSYKKGDVVIAEFVGADLDHSLHQGAPIAEVVFLNPSGQESVVLTDEDYELKVLWNDRLLGKSSVKIQWKIPMDIGPGTYKIRYRAKAKINIQGSLSDYVGQSKEFAIN